MEPLSLVPLNKNTNISTSDTANSSENIEFPSSALDLYTTLLNEIEGGGDSSNQQQISNLSPPKIPLPATLGTQGTSNGVLEVSGEFNYDFADYQPDSRHPVGDGDGTESEDQSLGMLHGLAPSLGENISHSTVSDGDFRASLNKTSDFSCGKNHQ